MKRTFNFQRQLAVGKKGEARFLAHYADIQPYANGRRGDFIGNTGQPMEVKFDSYSTAKTVNFFIERWGNVEKQKPGGPWQAHEHGCIYFVYTYGCGMCVWFELATLLPWLELNVERYNSRLIHNRGYSGMGYLVPRADLLQLAIKVDQLPEIV